MNDETKRPMLDWFVSPIKDVGSFQIVRNVAQTVSVDYPIMMYKGYMPDNRELVLVNLAKINSP